MPSQPPADHLGGWAAQLRKGVAELFVLQLLASRGPLHGYAVARELKELGDVVAGESTVYPLLRRLERDGLVDSEWTAPDEGNARKEYQITNEGSGFLKEALGEWGRLSQTMGRLKDGHDEAQS